MSGHDIWCCCLDCQERSEHYGEMRQQRAAEAAYDREQNRLAWLDLSTRNYPDNR